MSQENKVTNNDIYDDLFNKLSKRRDGYIKRVEVKYAGDSRKIEQVKININKDFKADLDKLKFVIQVINNDFLKRKFIEMANYINNFSDTDVNNENLLDAILAYGILLKKCAYPVTELDNETAYLLATIMAEVELSSFMSQGIMVSNKDILKNVMEKTTVMKERRNILYEIIDYFEITGLSSDCTEAQYNAAFSDCMSIIKRYRLETKNSKGKQS
jgi:hypothetical protein